MRINVLSDKDIEKIIEEGKALLIDPGIQVHNQEAVELLAEAGAKISPDKKVAYIPENLVIEALKTVPSNFNLFSLEGKPVVSYGSGGVNFNPGSTAISILDRDTERQRPPVTKDYIDFVKLVEGLSPIDAQSTSMVCMDVPEEIGDLYRLYLALNFMRKPIVTGAFRKDTWWTMLEMLIAVSGDLDSLKERPIALFDVCPSPPLLWSDLTCQNLLDCAKNGVPAQLISMPLAGATAPVTLAAAVVQHTAECLSGVVMHQLVNPGAPIVWGGSPSVLDMRNGSTPMGAPGTWLIDAAYVQVGKKLGIPTQVYMGMSDAKVVDAQCGMESMGGTLMAALSGADMVSGAGMLDFETCQSYEKLVIDAEMIGMSKRVVEGVQIREDPIALDIIQPMGHRGDYLSLPHTRNWWKKEFYLPTNLIDRGAYMTWIDNGANTIYDRAKSRVDEIIAQYEPPDISKELKQELRSITQSAANSFGMEKLPSLPE